MTKKPEQDHTLDALFDAARAHPPMVPEALTERVLADAAAQMPARPRSTLGRLREWVAVLGGFSGLGGMVTAGCLGFWIGLAPPATLPDVASVLLGTTQEEETTVAFESGWITGLEEGLNDE